MMMKILYVLFFIVFTTCNLWAQQEIVKSTEKVRVDGKVFYAHSVKPKETLYSLSKAYNVSIDDIVKNNSALAAGLKAGALVYIPVAENSEAAPAEVANKPVGEGNNVEKPVAPQNMKGFKRHKVKWFEDITSISEKYNVPVEAIIALNNLKEGKLKTRQVIYIPNEEYISNMDIDAMAMGGFAAVGEGQQIVVDSITVASKEGTVIDYLSNAVDGVKSWFNKPIEIACILPLNSRDTNKISNNFMDFYAGALLAVNDSKEKGLKLTVNVYDQNDYTPLHSLIDEPGFERNQLIIGPVRERDLDDFIGYSAEKEIPLVSPLDNAAESLANGNRFFMQMPSNTNAQIVNTVDLLERVKEANNVSTVLLVYEKGNTSDSLYVNSAKSLLDEKGINYTPVSYGILEGRDVYTTMLSLVDTLSAIPHIALIPSNSEAFVSDVVRNLDLCTKSGAKITLFGFPKWRNFETINIDLFHKMNLHISLGYFVDYNSGAVKDFLLKYRALYSTEPTPFAFQGYDITKYLLEQMRMHGNSFINKDALERTSMLQSDFELHRGSIDTGGLFKVVDPHSGLKNNATRNIRYNSDFTISVL